MCASSIFLSDTFDRDWMALIQQCINKVRIPPMVYLYYFYIHPIAEMPADRAESKPVYIAT